MASRTDVVLNETASGYPIWIGGGMFGSWGSLLQELELNPKKILIVTDPKIASHYLERVQAAIQDKDVAVECIQIAPGEAHKSLSSLETLYDKALAIGLKRRDLVVALGGGIIGDLTGFFAATYMRGVPFVQLPTTLLAQVDSSVGGKVAVNWRHMKNLIGNFYHPKAVLIDTNTLLTLPQREFACGMAEVIKYAFLQDSIPDFSHENRLFDHLNQDISSSSPELEGIILQCCQMKAAVVAADPQEQHGIREILNLGHTFAHAFETLTENRMAHGEAVSAGMVKAFQLAYQLGQIDSESVHQVMKLLQRHHLPVEVPESLTPDAILQVMAHDKKNRSSSGLRLVLPIGRIGQVQVQEGVFADQVRQVLETPIIC